MVQRLLFCQDSIYIGSRNNSKLASYELILELCKVWGGGEKGNKQSNVKFRILILCGIIFRTRSTVRRCKMKTKLRMVYWKGEKFWVGKLLEHPEIMTQGKTLAELEENMRDAYTLMTMEDVPEHYEIKELALNV
jgi:predicted RNase H-like HicB family nuclease